MSLKGLVGAADSEAKSAPESGSVEDEHLDDAFDAVGKDRKAFRAAMKAAIRACYPAAGDEDE